jgi:WD40 repeat protein
MPQLRRWPLAVLCSALLWNSVAGGETAKLVLPAKTPAEIDLLIHQLGSDEFDEREAAGKSLVAIGRPVLDALAKAATGSDDAEIRQRAGKLLKVVVPRYPELFCLQGHTEGINGIAFSPDGNRALSASHDHTIRVWDLKTGKELHCLKDQQDSVVCGVAFSPNGKRALSGGADQVVRLWDAETWKELRHFEGHGYCVRRVAFSADGRRAVSGGDDGNVLLWDLETGKELRRLTGHTTGINCVVFTPDSRKVLAGCWNGIRVWDTETGKEIRHFKHAKEGFFAVAFSPNGNRALSASGRTLHLWDVETEKVLRAFAIGPDERFADSNFAVDSLAFSPDGKQVLSGSVDHTIRLWEVETGRQLDCLQGDTETAHCLAFGPDGKRALSGDSDKKVRLWQLSPEAAKPAGRPTGAIEQKRE